MGRTDSTNNVLLSQSAEGFRRLTIDNGEVIISADDVLPIGDNTDFGSDYTGKKLFIYAEELLVSGKLRLAGGIVSAHRISLGGQTSSTIDVSGADGVNQNVPNEQVGKPGEKGGAGDPGGDFRLYTEDLDLDQPFLAIKATGGRGGNGQDQKEGIEVAGGDGGNGGAGGQVQALIVHPLRVFEERLISIYQDDQIKSKQVKLDVLLGAIKDVKLLSKYYAKLNQAKDLNNAAAVNKTILSLPSVDNLLDQWLNQFQIDVAGGSYGVYGWGRAQKGVNGQAGTPGTRTVDPVSATAESTKLSAFNPFMFVHPIQASMTLEKAKLMYFMADPVKDKDGIKDIIKLLDRLKKRTEVFATLDDQSELAKHYSNNESRIGALNSIESLKDIYRNVSQLLDHQITKGLNYFGYDNRYVPLASFNFYQELVSRLIDHFTKIESAYTNYYQQLKTNNTEMAQVKQLRRQLGEVIRNNPDMIEQLENRARDTANIIDSYQIILAPKKKALQDGMQKLKDEIEGKFDFNLEAFLSGLSMLAFAPQSGLMWITQAAQFGTQGALNITGENGEVVRTEYLIHRIKEAQNVVDENSLAGYAAEQDGTLTPDDPRALKLVTLEADTMKLLEGFYAKFPQELSELKRLFKDYVKQILARNNQLLTYNAIIMLLNGKHEEFNRAQEKISLLSDETLAKLKPDLPALAAFASHAYYSARAMIMENLYLTASAYRFWALSDENLIAKAYSGKKPPELNSDALMYAQDTILESYKEAIENFGSYANCFPYQQEQGVFFYLDNDQIETLKNQKAVMISIPAVIKDASSVNSPFRGMSNVRLTKVRVWLEGVQVTIDEASDLPGAGSEKLVVIDIRHTGHEKIVSPNNQEFEFNHKIKYTQFRYNFENNWIETDGDIGWNDEQNNTYALIGPFTTWHISVNPDYNPGVDLSGITQVKMEFHGTFYPFH